MASQQECEAALKDLGARLAIVDPDLRRKHAVDRTVACHITDLAVVFTGRLADGSIVEVQCHPSHEAEPAQLKLTTTSDDLVALVSGRLSPPAAWATGRLTVEASVLDLLRLRSLL